jgi:hypothetical protein
MKRIRQAILAAMLLLAVAGCGYSGGALVDADQPSWDRETTLALEPGDPVGQTFVARHGGLAAVEFLLIPTAAAAPSLTLHLRTEPQSASDLVTATLQLPPDAEAGFYRFAFPALEASHGEYYYAFIEGAEPGIAVALGSGETYLDGAAHKGHRPLDAQTTFQLVYAPGQIALDLVQTAWGWLGLLAAAGLLFVVPGWALIACLWPGRPLSWAETLGLAVGVSLALYPVLFLWTDLIGVHLGRGYAWLPAASGVAALFWRYRSWLTSLVRSKALQPRKPRLQAWTQSQTFWPGLALLALFGLVLAARLLAVRTLDAPMWGDSYQHTMIVQLLVDHDGLFDSWLPYAELDRFTYHFGFHSATAVLHWVTGKAPIVATLLMGQLLTGLAAISLYPLAVRVTGNQWGGVGAVLLAGLLAPMPMSYVNWGRYTQLAGLVILPVAVWLTWEVVDLPRKSWRLLGVSALVAGGLALTHYRVLMFYALFVVVLIAASVAQKTGRETVLRLSAVGLGGGLLFLPWFVRSFGASFLEAFLSQASTLPSEAHAFTWTYNALGDPSSFLAPGWWLVMILGLGFGLWHRQRAVALAGLWWFLLLIATNPAWLALPGTGVITNFALFISVYIPAGLFVGVLVAQIGQLAGRRTWLPVFGALAVVLLGLASFQDRIADVRPEAHALVTRPDLRAAAWIQTNTPPESRFWVNSFFAYADTSVVGSDAGWWLPLLARRANTVPPLNYGSDLPVDSEYRQEINDLQHQIKASGLRDPAAITSLREAGVTHVYIGQRQGTVNAPRDQVIDPYELSKDPHYDVIYHEDRVWIFALLPATAISP